MSLASFGIKNRVFTLFSLVKILKLLKEDRGQTGLRLCLGLKTAR